MKTAFALLCLCLVGALDAAAQCPWGTPSTTQITNNCNLGIGPSNNPTGVQSYGPVLHLNGAGPSLRIQDTTSGGDWNIFARYGASANLFRIYDNLAGLDRLVIDPGGKVGIGTLFPTVSLDVNPSSGVAYIQAKGTNAGLLLNHTATNFQSSINFRENGAENFIIGTSVYNPDSTSFDIGTGGASLFRIQANGNVGIGVGTAAPNTRLDVAGGTISMGPLNGAGEIRFRTGFANNATGGSGISAADHNGSNIDGLAVYGYDGISFHTGANQPERVRIDSASGNVGIGTATPLASLSIAGGIGPAHQIGILSNAGSSTSTPGVFLGSNGNYSGAGATAYFGLMGSPNGYPYDFALVGSSDVQTPRYLRIGYADADDPSRPFHSNVSINTVTGDLHSSGTITADVAIRATFQDVAEWVPVLEQMTPGTVVIVSDDAKNTVAPSNGAYDTRVAGVVSPAPGLLLGVESSSKAKIATTGRVKVRVDASRAAIHLGDLLVTSDTPGTAMKSEPLDLGGVKIHRPGTLIGKALEPLAKGQGEILVLLSLQ